MSKKNEETVKRGPGRPASFPGVETVAFLAHIPTETREMVRNLAEKRGEPVNVTLDRMIQRAFKDANRSRKQGTKAAN